VSARSKWTFETVGDENVFALHPSKTASMYPVEYGTEESDGHCGNPSCGVILAKGLSAAGISRKFAEAPLLIRCPKCLAYNRVPRP
jgi:hypothetical protein